MIYGYLRKSKAKQDLQRQRRSIAKHAKEHHKDQQVELIEDSASGKTTWKKRKIGDLIPQLKKDDVIIFDDLTRVGRNFYETSAIIAEVLSVGAAFETVDPYHSFQDDVVSKVYSFAFSLAADLQREFISKQTKSGLASAKEQGKILGRPPGSTRVNDKVIAQEEEIRKLKKLGLSDAKCAKMLGVSRSTFMRNWKRLNEKENN